MAHQSSNLHINFFSKKLVVNESQWTLKSEFLFYYLNMDLIIGI